MQTSDGESNQEAVDAACQSMTASWLLEVNQRQPGPFETCLITIISKGQGAYKYAKWCLDLEELQERGKIGWCFFSVKGQQSTRHRHRCHRSLNCVTCLTDAAYCCLCLSYHCDPLLPSVLSADFFPFICCICYHHLLHCTMVWSMSMQPPLLVLAAVSSHLAVLCRHITNVDMTVAAS